MQSKVPAPATPAPANSKKPFVKPAAFNKAAQLANAKALRTKKPAKPDLDMDGE